MTLIFYTTRFLNGHAGTVKVFLIPVIFIDPKYKDDVGLYEHEYTHVKQAFRNIIPLIHTLRYKLSKSYRLKCEVEAYKTQLDYYADDRSLLFASFIANDYGLSVPVKDALSLLQEQ